MKKLVCDRCGEGLPKETMSKIAEPAVLVRHGALPAGKDFTLKFLCPECSQEMGVEPGTVLFGETDVGILEANRASLERLDRLRSSRRNEG